MAKVTIDTKETFFVNPFHFGINYDMFLDALKGKTVKEVFEKEPGYYSWMMQGDFPLYTKKIITQIRLSMK